MSVAKDLFNIEELADKSAMVFSSAEFLERVGRLSQKLQELKVDVYIGSTPENLNYFAGFDPLGLYFFQRIFFAPGMVAPTLLTHKCEKELARTQCWIDDISIWQHGDDPLQMTIEKLRALGVQTGSRVGLEMDNWYFKASTYKGLVEALPGVEFVDVTHDILRLRTIKSSAEIGEHLIYGFGCAGMAA
jgi:Xaa-Pro dipeptidase